MDPAKHNPIRSMLLSVFKIYSPMATEETLEAIEKKCGIKVSFIQPSNAEQFLEALKEELLMVTNEFKSKFVVGVFRKLLKEEGKI